MQTYEKELNQLDSGRQWIDYLTSNGWTLGNVSPNLSNAVLGNHEKAFLTKAKSARFLGEVDYILSFESSEKYGTRFVCMVTANGQTTLKNRIECDGFEQDLIKFAFLADGMGWVSLKEANAKCKVETGAGILEYLLKENEAKQNGLFDSLAGITRPMTVAEIFNPIIKAHTGYEQAY